MQGKVPDMVPDITARSKAAAIQSIVSERPEPA